MTRISRLIGLLLSVADVSGHLIGLQLLVRVTESPVRSPLHRDTSRLGLGETPLRSAREGPGTEQPAQVFQREGSVGRPFPVVPRPFSGDSLTLRSFAYTVTGRGLNSYAQAFYHPATDVYAPISLSIGALVLREQPFVVIQRVLDRLLRWYVGLLHHFRQFSV